MKDDICFILILVLIATILSFCSVSCLNRNLGGIAALGDQGSPASK